MRFCVRIFTFFLLRLSPAIYLLLVHEAQQNSPYDTQDLEAICSGSSTESADGLAFPTKTKTFWVIKYLNIYPTNK